jgi:hypothetical protein
VRGDAALDKDLPEEFCVKCGLPSRGETEWNEREREVGMVRGKSEWIKKEMKGVRVLPVSFHLFSICSQMGRRLERL